ncbi:hypothetical protein CEXT_258611 [Caerostris extrusa]|uniref:Uncharacterized protein n=1 Tax=Caerostris extrusa TaxID=172846 RepID=A0AAV4M2Y8_CAEEX|nr:hypothetical protein CEXT_258611 [Caerostris extrusa]
MVNAFHKINEEHLFGYSTVDIFHLIRAVLLPKPFLVRNPDVGRKKKKKRKKMAENDEATTSKSLVSNFWRLKTEFKMKQRPKYSLYFPKPSFYFDYLHNSPLRHFPLGFTRVYCPNLSLLENPDVGRKKKKKKRMEMPENDEATTSKSVVSNF